VVAEERVTDKNNVMPKILDKRVKTLKNRGMPEQKAWATATSSLQKEGKLKQTTTWKRKKKERKKTERKK
jgi:hypothetical protein